MPVQQGYDWALVGKVALFTVPVHLGAFLVWLILWWRRRRQLRQQQEQAKPARLPDPDAALRAFAGGHVHGPPAPPPAIAAEAPTKPQLTSTVGADGKVEIGITPPKT
jgi:uncharacterized membrane protein